jgi:hypothetical protein
MTVEVGPPVTAVTSLPAILHTLSGSVSHYLAACHIPLIIKRHVGHTGRYLFDSKPSRGVRGGPERKLHPLAYKRKANWFRQLPEKRW